MIETHVFILWEAAVKWDEANGSRVSGDIYKHFLVIAEDTVDDADVREVMRRVYRIDGPLLEYKRAHCGAGPFKVLIVLDCVPSYETRSTSHGIRQVNRNMYDLKVKYREWMGGGHTIHVSDDPEDAYHTLEVLYG